MWDHHTTRNPILLLRLFGWLWLRYDAAANSGLLFEAPPHFLERSALSPGGGSCRPISATMRLTCPYWPSESQRQRWARGR